MGTQNHSALLAVRALSADVSCLPPNDIMSHKPILFHSWHLNIQVPDLQKIGIQCYLMMIRRGLQAGTLDVTCNITHRRYMMFNFSRTTNSTMSSLEHPSIFGTYELEEVHDTQEMK